MMALPDTTVAARTFKVWNHSRLSPKRANGESAYHQDGTHCQRRTFRLIASGSSAIDRIAESRGKDEVLEMAATGDLMNLIQLSS